MSSIPPDVQALILELANCYRNLTDAVKEENREKALGAVTDAALITMRLAAIKPFRAVGIVPLTREEESQFKENLLKLIG